MSALTLGLTGNSSTLRANYFPPIQLDPLSNYEVALIDFQTYNTIPNITESNNKFHVLRVITEKIEFGIYQLVQFKDLINVFLKSTRKWTHDSLSKLQEFRGFDDSDYESFKLNNKSKKHVQFFHYDSELSCEIPVGSYEMDDIIKYLKRQLPSIQIEYDRNTRKTSINVKCAPGDNLLVDFTPDGTLRHILGFSNIMLQPNQKYVGQYEINITNINTIRVECDLATGSYTNGKSTHTIHEFYPEVPAGYKIVQVPKNLIYLPVIKRTIQTLTCDIVDQNGNLIDFRGETITCRLHIRKI